MPSQSPQGCVVPSQELGNEIDAIAFGFNDASIPSNKASTMIGYEVVVPSLLFETDITADIPDRQH